VHVVTMSTARGPATMQGMKKTLSTLWVWLAIVLPALFAFGLAADPAKTIEMNSGAGVVYMFALRQLVFAGVTLFAWLKLPRRTTALLLAGRGVTDLGDGVVTFALTGSPMAAVPVVMAVVSFVVMAALWAEEPAKS
jgi:hypothetical protein